jgi:Cu(I)/Ag(I) efflux system membrane fusion protein
MGMDYIPVYADEVSGDGATVRISPEKIQRTGVRTAPVERLSLAREVRGSGMVLADEGRTAVVTAKFSGFVERLTVRTTGEQVRAGQPLLTLWVESADLLRKMVDLATAARTGQPTETAARNLRIFGVSEDDIASIVRSDASLRTITLTAPLSGTVLEKPAFDGTRFEPGDVLFRVADLSSVWVIANVAEQDLALVRPGLVARLTLSSYPGETIEGTVDFIYPELDLETRSGRVRLIVPNEQGRLRLGMFVHAAIDAPIGESAVLAIPISAVIDDGERQVAFVARGEGRFEPRDLVLGARAGDLIEVREGLTEGDEVVAQGTFLIDAESNLQSALATFAAGPGVQ